MAAIKIKKTVERTFKLPFIIESDNGGGSGIYEINGEYHLQNWLGGECISDKKLTLNEVKKEISDLFFAELVRKEY